MSYRTSEVINRDLSMRLTYFLIVLLLFETDTFGQEIFSAIRNRDLEAVRSILDKHPDEAKITDMAKNTPLHYAAEFGNEQIVSLLLSKGAEENALNFYYRTPYQKAVIFGRTAIAEILRSNGADTGEWKPPSYKGRYFGQTPPGDIPEIFAPGIISREYRADWSITFSPEGNEIYYTQRMQPDHGGRIWFTEYNDKSWLEPEPALFTYDSDNLFSMEGFEYEPHIIPDGNKILYGSKRPLPGQEEANPDFLYWIAEREGNGWGEPYLLDKIVNDLKPMFVSLTNDGTIYFTNSIEYKSYKAELKNGKYEKPVRLPDEINYLGQAAHPFISPDESYLIFDGRTENKFELPIQLYISFRKEDGSWTKAVKFDKKINSLNPAHPYVSRDGRYMFFSSMKTGYGDIYWVDASVINDIKKSIIK